MLIVLLVPWLLQVSEDWVRVHAIDRGEASWHRAERGYFIFSGTRVVGMVRAEAASRQDWAAW
jgi:hypothetical protein